MMAKKAKKRKKKTFTTTYANGTFNCEGKHRKKKRDQFQSEMESNREK